MSSSAPSGKINPLAPVDEVQVNFCRMPDCGNFGQPSSPALSPSPRRYRLYNKGKAKPLGIECTNCGKVSPIKSNLGVAEELARASEYLRPQPIVSPSCPNPKCRNHGHPIGQSRVRYHRRGKTKAGSQRFRCLKCLQSFTVPIASATLRQRRKDASAAVFLALMNGAAIRRICEMNRISPPTVYKKLDLAWRQCRSFAAAQERRLPKLPIERLWLSSDRQDYLVNWNSRHVRTPSQLGAIATADNPTSYVFAIHLDYDPSLNQKTVEAEALATGDLALRPQRRRHARLWFQGDYKQAVKAERAAALSAADDLPEDIARAYREALKRDDIEAPPVEADRKLPNRGVQVLPDYAMYGHFQHVQRLVGHAGKVRLCLDLDSAIRGACLSAFHKQIRAGRCDVFYVAIAKRVPRDEKEHRVGTAWAEFDQRLEIVAQQIAAGEQLDKIDEAMLQVQWDFDHVDPSDTEILAALEHRRERAKHRRRARRAAGGAKIKPQPAASPRDRRVEAFVLRLMIQARLGKMTPKGSWGDMWLEHPLPTLAEPRKWIAYLTDRKDMDEKHLANIYAKASLHGIDRFFMVLRRRINMAERSLNTATRGNRLFHIYQPYDPGILAKLIEMLRIYFNFVLTGADKRTPAMRLGLMDRPATIEEILGFTAVGSDADSHENP